MMRSILIFGFLSLTFIVSSGCGVLINPTPEMVVKQDTTEIPSGTGVYDFGDVRVGDSSSAVIFTIENTGNTLLKLADTPDTIIITGANIAEFAIDQTATKTELKPEESTTFTVTFVPTSEGASSARISIDNNDSNENPYTFEIKGAGVVPEINVKQGTTDIVSGSGVYDFGNVKVGETSPVIVFTIENLGSAELLLTSSSDLVIISGADAVQFTIDQTSTETPINPGSFTTFTITFSPTSIGTKSATIIIANDDSDENPYFFSITGNGITAPEINIKEGSQNIFSGSGIYNFNNTLVGDSSSAITFTIENLGTIDLNLTGSPDLIEITGTDAAMFTVDESSTNNPVTFGNSTTFTITFNPTSIGLKSATISIASNDYDENPYTFSLTATGISPEINVKQGTDNIPSGTGSYDFGRINVGKSSSAITFTIENLGTAPLTLAGSPDLIDVTGTDAAMFTIGQSATITPISPAASTTFTITFIPSAAGNISATISIANNDYDENPYTFTIRGTGFCYLKGDFNGDGYQDIIVGARTDDDGGNRSGCVFIFFGKQNWNPRIDASNADVKLIGDDTGDHFGVSVSSAGDVNHDGYDDVIVGADEDDDGGGNSGCAFIFFGSSNPSSVIDASNADVKLIGGDANDQFGISVSSAGDVNNDGYDDVIVGAHYDEEGGYQSGSAFIFFGRYNWTTVVDASNANVKLIGADADDQFGENVSNAGDVNGDGYDDVIVGAKYDSDNGTCSGCAFIFFGSFSPSSVIDASNADVKLIGEDTHDFFGASVSSAGDFNGDGVDDVIVGAWGDDDGGYNSGCTFIFYGSSNLSSVIDASNADIKLIGEDFHDNFGISVSNADDINHDGYDDVIVGAESDDDGGRESGCAFIFFGSSNPTSIIDASNANVKLKGIDADYMFGGSVSSAGDVNVDGFDDVIVGARFDDEGGTNSGCAFIFFGNSTPSTIIDASNANVKLIGEDAGDEFGFSVAGGK
ncbi:MAG: choice-of-anchor D domain-containing protein [Planctomycetes bacterium]|nr:choice-of-anchor D domain-containing protein [Planctomycetota bacterium]